MRDRVICSGEKLCGCVVEPKTGDIKINPAMKNCARYIKGKMGDKYCCLTRDTVHIIK
jgi:hypothetical protein